jgi:transposase
VTGLHGFTGGNTIVKDYVAQWRQRSQEMFVPLGYPPGHAQVDFGEAIGIIGEEERKIHFLTMDLPHADARLVVAHPAETTEAFCDEQFGPLPSRGAEVDLYDNSKIAVARILGDGERQRTARVSATCSRIICSRNGSVGLGNGNEKGKIEGLVGYTRSNFLVPRCSKASPSTPIFSTPAESAWGSPAWSDEAIGERLQRDLAALPSRFRRLTTPARNW